MGYSVATTVIAAAATHDLTDLAAVREELSLAAADTSKDAWLRNAIRRVSEAIATNVNRVFAPEFVEDAFDIVQDAYPAQTPGGFRHLPLTRYPAIAIASVTQARAPGSEEALTEGTDFRYDAASGELLRLNRFTGAGTRWEAVPVTVRYLAGYGSAVEEAHAVPASPPYTVTMNSAASFSCDRAVSYADGTALVRVAASPGEGEYAVAAATGIYSFAAADAGATLTFSYATRAIPGDLEDACLRIVTGRYHSKGRDPALIQRDTPGVGTERWWFGGAPGQKGAFPPDIDAMLEENYRMPVVA